MTVEAEPSEETRLLDSRGAEQATARAAPRLSAAQRLVLVVAGGLIIFTQACNFSLLTTIQGAVAADLDAYDYLTWLTAAFLVPLSSFGPVAGRLCDVFSPRRCIVFGCVILAIGCLVSSLAQVLSVFIIGRACTGTGTSFVMTGLVNYIIRSIAHEKRGTLLGAFSTAITIGVAMGAVISGAVEGFAGWRVLFWGQAPIALICGACIFWAMPSGSTTVSTGDRLQKMWTKLSKIDYLGAATLTSATVSLLLALSFRRIEESLIVVSLFLFAVFVLIESYVANDPIIPMKVLGSRGALLSCVAILLYMMPRWSLLFYTPMFTIAVRGWQPAFAGLMLLPTNLGFAIGSLVAGTLHIRRSGSFYLPSVMTYAAGAVIMLLLVYTATSTTSLVLFAALSFLHGVTSGAASNYSLVHVLHLTPTFAHGIVPSLHATFRGSAGSFGSAIGGGLFGRMLHADLQRNFADRNLDAPEQLLREIAGNPRLVWQLAGMEHDAALEAYATAIRGLFLVGVALFASAAVLQALAGWAGADAEPRSHEHDALVESAEEML